jgi:hypothetical protein
VAEYLHGLTRSDLEDYLENVDAHSQRPWSDRAARISILLDLDSERLRDKAYYAKKWRWHLKVDGSKLSPSGARSRVRRAWPDIVRGVLDRVTSYGRQVDPRRNSIIKKVPDEWWEYVDYAPAETNNVPTEKGGSGDRDATASDREPIESDRENPDSEPYEGGNDRAPNESDRDPTASDRGTPYTSRASSLSTSFKSNNNHHDARARARGEAPDLSFLGSKSKRYEDQILQAILAYCPNGREPPHSLDFLARSVFGRRGAFVTTSDIVGLADTYGIIETCAALVLTKLHKTSDPSLSYTSAILENFKSGTDEQDSIADKYGNAFE